MLFEEWNTYLIPIKSHIHINQEENMMTNYTIVVSSDSEEDKTVDKKETKEQEVKSEVKEEDQSPTKHLVTQERNIILSSDTDDDKEKKQETKEEAKEEDDRPTKKIKTFSELYDMSTPPVFDLANSLQENQGNPSSGSGNKKLPKKMKKHKKVVFSKKSRSRKRMGDPASIRKGCVVVLDAPREGEKDFEDNPKYNYFYNQNEKNSPLWIAEVQSFMRRKGKAELKYYHSPNEKTILSENPEFILDEEEFCVQNVNRAHRLTIKIDDFSAETLMEKLAENGFGKLCDDKNDDKNETKESSSSDDEKKNR